MTPLSNFVNVQGTSALGAYDSRVVFNVTIPAKPSQGFAALGTDSYGLADFDNLLITSKADGMAKMESYRKSAYKPLYFAEENH